MITFKAKTENGGFIPSALEPFTFPAGEAHVKRDESKELQPVEVAIINSTPDSMHTDLFHLAMWNDYIQQTGQKIKKVIVIPYMPGARADRGNPWGARIYAQFLGLINPDQVIILDPHSPVIYEELQLWCTNAQITVVDTNEIIASQLQNIFDGVIAPDKGAVTRAAKAAEKLDIPVFKAGKTRDEATGKLSGFHMEDELMGSGRYLIVDDICDGGGTFMGLATAIKDEYPDVELELFVTHGVFSGSALRSLPAYFKRVYTTNSYHTNRYLHVHKDENESLASEFDLEDDSPTVFERINVTKLLLDNVI